MDLNCTNVISVAYTAGKITEGKVILCKSKDDSEQSCKMLCF